LAQYLSAETSHQQTDDREAPELRVRVMAVEEQGQPYLDEGPARSSVYAGRPARARESGLRDRPLNERGHGKREQRDHRDRQDRVPDRAEEVLPKPDDRNAGWPTDRAGSAILDAVAGFRCDARSPMNAGNTYLHAAGVRGSSAVSGCCIS